MPETVLNYRVYRSLNSAQWLLFAATTNTAYTFTNVAPAYYRYRVTAVNSFGESLPSNEVGVDMRIPSSPTNLNLTVEIIIP